MTRGAGGWGWEVNETLVIFSFQVRLSLRGIGRSPQRDEAERGEGEGK